jgi:hypothetical protein
VCVQHSTVRSTSSVETCSSYIKERWWLREIFAYHKQPQSTTRVVVPSRADTVVPLSSLHAATNAASSSLQSLILMRRPYMSARGYHRRGGALVAYHTLCIVVGHGSFPNPTILDTRDVLPRHRICGIPCGPLVFSNAPRGGPPGDGDHDL